ncbi:MAG: NAD-dependent epimerase/dehydratase family protein [Rhizobiales bacterium]|nr:NAD-dependent epimerase/dehydratase family protein [Hyphomicrobiales bacterium]
MRIFLAGATGVIGRRLVHLLRPDGYDVFGTTRSDAKAGALRLVGATPVVVDVYDAPALMRAVQAAMPDIVIHQLTDLPQVDDPARMEASRAANARLRIDGTRNLVAAAKAAGAKRIIAQSIAFVYAAGEGARVETDPLAMQPDGTPGTSLRGVIALEQQVVGAPGIDGIVLRYGRLYGPGTWSETGPSGPGSLHVDAAAYAARLAVTCGAPGIYNIAEDDGAVAIDKARHELGFDPQFRTDAR